MKKQYSSKQRKIHKLKRENVVLGRWREQMLVYGLKNSTLRCHPNGEDELTKCFDFLDAYRISHLSFEMGKNSAKIQRLRTQIQQEKSLSDKFYAAVKELQETLRGKEHARLNYFEEIELMGDVAEEVGVLYEHPIDKDCYVFRDESGFVMKAPKAIVDHPNLKEILNEHSTGESS